MVDPPAPNELIVGDEFQAGLVDADHILSPTALGLKDLQEASKRGFLVNQNEDEEVEHNDTAQAEFMIELLELEPLLPTTRQPFEAQSPLWSKDVISRLLRPLSVQFGSKYAGKVDSLLSCVNLGNVQSFPAVLEELDRHVDQKKNHFLLGRVWMTYRENVDEHL